MDGARPLICVVRSRCIPEWCAKSLSGRADSHKCGRICAMLTVF